MKVQLIKAGKVLVNKSCCYKLEYAKFSKRMLALMRMVTNKKNKPQRIQEK